MSSKVEIINMALALLGEPPITSPDESSKPARVAATFYTAARDKALRDHPWNFAIKRTTLAAAVGTPVFEFTYSYPLPEDCLRVLYTEDQWFYRTSGNYWPYKIEGRNLLTDLDECKIIYISKVEEEGRYDPSFVIAFSFMLAYLMANSMTEHRTKSEDMLRQYAMQLSEARFADAQEGTADPVEEGGWIDSRA